MVINIKKLKSSKFIENGLFLDNWINFLINLIAVF